MDKKYSQNLTKASSVTDCSAFFPKSLSPELSKSKKSLEKTYFTERGLFQKAADMNIHNNMRMKCIQINKQVFWYYGREDILREFQINSQLHYPNDNAEVRFDIPKAFVTPNHKTIPIISNSTPNLQKQNKFSQSLLMPPILPKETTLNPLKKPIRICKNTPPSDLPEKPPGIFTTLMATRNNVLLRFYKDSSKIKPKHTRAANFTNSMDAQKPHKKGYDAMTETNDIIDEAPCELQSFGDMRRSFNVPSKPYDLINYTNNPAFVGEYTKFFEKNKNANHRQNTMLSHAIEKAKGENTNEKYQETIKKFPSIFRKSIGFATQEVSSLKTYSPILRPILSIKR